MKKHIRLSAFLCTLALLWGMIGCTGTPVTPEPSVTIGETVSGSQTDDESEKTESVWESDTESTFETESDDGTDTPRDAIRLFTAQELHEDTKKVRLTSTLETDDAGYAYLTCRPEELDPWFVLANSDRKAVIGARYMRIKYRTTVNVQGRLFLGEKTIDAADSLALNFKPDGEWHILTVDLMRSEAFADKLSRLRFDPMDGVALDEEVLDVAWIAFCPPSDDPTVDFPPLPDDTPDLSQYKSIGTQDNLYYYRASHYLTCEKEVYTFKEDFVLDIYARGYFNRYTIGYTSSAPLKGEITYLMWSEDGQRTEKVETFFLEAGDQLLFNSLIDDYARNMYAFGVERITLSTCDDSTATFSLVTLGDTAWEVYPSTYYLENDRYKLGVLLSWGGGISYIEDKQDEDDSIGNLINRADPGRLVQQSYYGVLDGPLYTGAYYGETLWGYNPVQGGDQYGNGSKLVDVQMSPDGTSLYIKCRPMDWAHDNSPTPSYMENTYILETDRIRVQNRFVDFMGVPHPARHAELPAFYTISYLGVFHYYNGTKPWTGDAYETLPNEPFWAGNSKAYHNIKKGNTETWAAWTNTAGYGIGLYVPGTEIMLAGRYDYNGSKNPANGGTSYVAPLRTMKFFSFEPFEYEYVIAAGTVDEMRDTFKDYHEQVEKQ